MKARLSLNYPQNSHNLRAVIDIERHHVFSSFNCQPYQATWLLASCMAFGRLGMIEQTI